MSKALVIAGSLAQKPGRGGHTWVFLQYLLGFRKLGWDVLFLDRLDPNLCGDGAPTVEESRNVRYLAAVMERFGFDGHYALVGDGGRTVGLSRRTVLDRVAGAEALINVMGFLDDPEILAAARKRVFLDIDPGFGQMWQALGLHDAFKGHDAYVTIAENIGTADCRIPTCGLPWVTTRQPVVLDEWPVAAASSADAGMTSIGSWRGAYGPVEYGGTTYGLRAHEFRKFATLPRMAGGRFSIALDIHRADAKDIDLLSSNGWSLVAPERAAGDPWRYRDFIQGSAAEVMIAKGMYVQTRSGWFSDRSVCYLASGRPVLAQDTGVSTTLPTGTGLVTFSTLTEAAAGAARIGRDYASHARAARRIAERFFESSQVLGALARKLDLS
jgi:hypothetical protein